MPCPWILYLLPAASFLQRSLADGPAQSSSPLAGDVQLEIEIGGCCRPLHEVNAPGAWGRLLARNLNSSGFVSEKGFDDKAALVACKQLGYRSGWQLKGGYQSWDRLGVGSDQPVVLSDIRCSGSEDVLSACSHTWGHYVDARPAGVLCSSKAWTEEDLAKYCPVYFVVDSFGVWSRYCSRDFDGQFPLIVLVMWPGSTYFGTAFTGSYSGCASLYRSFAEIDAHWATIGDDVVPSMQGSEWQFPWAIKRACHSDLMAKMQQSIASNGSALVKRVEDHDAYKNRVDGINWGSKPGSRDCVQERPAVLDCPPAPRASPSEPASIPASTPASTPDASLSVCLRVHLPAFLPAILLALLRLP
eukprot:TRINITY_DN64590_c0_g1_i1.p1 TRINITY_DN64590_c0_g1~~TRINITY_DN64590_c0_g1_i1.p1  ORF type:complete len:375 (-),score=31.11 TRINITY_DN64590_c0_g1_i1:49-1125(-)